MLTLFHDYTSPASAVAVARLQRLADEGLDVEFEGLDALGVDMALPVTLDVLAELDQIAGEAAAEGLTLRRPRLLQPTAGAHLVAGLAASEGLGASWRRRCYQAVWTEDQEIGDSDVLALLAQEAGLDARWVRDALTRPGGLPALRRRHGTHRRNGVGGVPTILAARTLVPGLLADEELRTLAALG